MIRLRCGEDLREVSLSETGGRSQVNVDGRSFTLDVEEVAPGRFVLRDGEHTRTFHCVRDGDTLHLFWEGVAYRLVEEREGARRAQRHHASGLEAPMPGKVIAVKVEPGQKVKKGEEVLIVEAMKMENALRAPQDGVVTRVAVRVGDPVAPGVSLVEIE